MLVGIAAVILVLGVASYMFVAQGGGNNADEEGEEEIIDAVTMQASDIGLTLEAGTNNQEVIMTIDDTSKFDSFEYELNYKAVEGGQEVDRGAIGSGEVMPGESSITREITIGTCSSGTCKYDKGVTAVTLVLRLNLKDGQTGMITEELSLE